MRAAHPQASGDVTRDGVAIHFECYGEGAPTILLLPTWSLVHSRQWKLQLPYLARHFRVVAFDGRGNGRSGRPADPSAYTDVEFAADAVAVMDATGTERAALLSVSRGALWALRLCAEHPDRVLGTVFIGAAARLAAQGEERRAARFEAVIDQPTGWQRHNAHFWRTNYADYVKFFMSQLFTEPHSTKPFEDGVDWALETDADTLTATERGLHGCDTASALALVAKLRCPVLVIHGSDDAIRAHDEAEALAAHSGGALVTIAGGGHWPHVRDPVQVNLVVKQFIDRIAR